MLLPRSPRPAYGNRRRNQIQTATDAERLVVGLVGRLLRLDQASAELPTSAAARLAQHRAAIVISNHGGCQFDGGPATIDVLPRIAEIVGGDAEILLDSGVRRGVDVLSAVALGARACLIGRPYMYGPGQAGAEHVIRLLGNEIRRAMILLGVSRVDKLDHAFVQTSDSRSIVG